MPLDSAHTLIVDDSAPIRLVLSKFLKDFGIQIITEAKDGVEALSKLKLHQRSLNPVNLILLDWNMPKMNGLDVVKTVKKDPGLSDVPILMVTSMGNEKDVLSAIQAGVSGYVVKPFNDNIIYDKLKEVYLVE